MRARCDKCFLIRLAAILTLGAIAIVAVALYRRSQRLQAAPADVQRQGLALVEDIVARIAATECGRSRRGRLLCDTVAELVARRRVVFSGDIASQALYRDEAGGGTLYVKVLRLGGRLVHQTPEEIAEGLFHEAVHARQSQHGESSVEEECDGYAAGLCAGAAVAGRTLPDVLTIEAATVAEFVRAAYPGLPRRPDYQPVGESREWLVRRTGLP